MSLQFNKSIRQFAKLMVYIFSGLCLVMLAIPTIQEGSAAEDFIELTVSTRCDPQSQIVNPTSIDIKVAFGSSASGPTALATMNTYGEITSESTSTHPYWENPNKGWVSFVFDGPPISANYYCQQDWGEKKVHLSYEPSENVKLYLTTNNMPSSNELDVSDIDTRSTIRLAPPGNDDIRYSAGKGSVNPYGLQVAIPIYGQGKGHTVLQNNFM